jgi:hypothetical protein
VVGTETYSLSLSLGISEWSYGLDRPYIVHVSGGWEQSPFYTSHNDARSANRYDLGFLCSGLALLFWGLMRGRRTRRGRRGD